MQSGQRLHRQLGFLLRAAPDLIALHGGRHIGEHQDEMRPVVADIAVEAPGHRDPHLLGDVGVELDLGAVAERDAFPDGVVLGGQLDRKRARQIAVRRIRRRHPVGRARLTCADRRDVDITDVGCEYCGQPLAGYIGGVTRYRHDGGHQPDTNVP